MKFIQNIKDDIQIVFKRDPAAKTTIEILTCYPGLHAIWLHRIAHKFWNNKHFLTARIISNISRTFTNIEIHPAAVIGNNVFIDHGSGIVIGETSEIGDNCLMYQGVVLGGISHNTGKRHPTLGKNVVVGAGAILLGPINIGDNARIGAGSVLLKDVKSNTTVVGVPANETRNCSGDLNHSEIGDPVYEKISKLENRIRILEQQTNR
jgi:serine O-acetyltransferase